MGVISFLFFVPSILLCDLTSCCFACFKDFGQLMA